MAKPIDYRNTEQVLRHLTGNRLTDEELKDLEIYVDMRVKRAVSEYKGKAKRRDLALLSRIKEEIPKSIDLLHPTQQSWKLGGTDQGSYVKGYSDSNAKCNQTIDNIAKGIRGEHE